MSIFALGKDKIQVAPVRSGYSSNNKKTQVNIFANGGPQKKFLLYSRWITKAGGTYLLFIKEFSSHLWYGLFNGYIVKG